MVKTKELHAVTNACFVLVGIVIEVGGWIFNGCKKNGAGTHAREGKGGRSQLDISCVLLDY